MHRYHERPATGGNHNDATILCISGRRMQRRRGGKVQSDGARLPTTQLASKEAARKPHRGRGDLRAIQTDEPADACLPTNAPPRTPRTAGEGEGPAKTSRQPTRTRAPPARCAESARWDKYYVREKKR